MLHKTYLWYSWNVFKDVKNDRWPSEESICLVRGLLYYLSVVKDLIRSFLLLEMVLPTQLQLLQR